MARYRVGVDIGGTFTDVMLLDDHDGAQLIKVPTTPGRFTEGLMHGVRRLERPASEMELFSHGTTVATNAVVERRGAHTALITTRGFQDTLLLRRTDRVQFDLWWQPPETLIPRHHIFEVTERLNYRGDVVTAFDEAGAREVARRLVRLGFQAVAIVFLHSFMNPAHESAMGSILREEGFEGYVTLSSEILPEILEYERTATTTVNAYVGPIMSKYFGRLSADLADHGYGGDILISSSTGGVMTPNLASQVPAKTMASGPAAGVIAAADICRRAGFVNVITFDMGGTSLDLGLIEAGAIRRTNEWEVAFRTPVRFPAVDVKSIGAGGGSIAWVDEAGVLHSGPQSASAEPGPACYGRGGTEPTNTDAQVLLGRLHPDRFLGGEMRIFPELAREAVQRGVGRRLAMDEVDQAAEAILTISNNNMVQATRLTTVYRGYDPRDFVLFAFGGAGPLSAAEIAREGDIPTVVVPPNPGLVSALGLLLMDVRHELSRSILRPLAELEASLITQVIGELGHNVRQALGREGIHESRIEVVAEADLRYYGMSNAITLPVGEHQADIGGLARRFEDTHQREYGYTVTSDVAVVELATIRVAGIGAVERSALPAADGQWRVGQEAPPIHRKVFFDGRWHETAVYDRSRLRQDDIFAGPAIIEQVDSTTVVPPGTTARVDANYNIIIDVRGGGS